MPQPLQPDCSNQSQQSLADERETLPPFFFCPLALWIRKVLLGLSDRVSNIDLNSLTQLIPDGSTFSPQPLTCSSHSIIPAPRSLRSWKPAQSAHRVAPCPNKLNHGNGRQELKRRKKPCLDSCCLIVQRGF